VLVGDAAKVPLVALFPLHPPEAMHENALGADQVTVETLPDVMLAGFAEIVTPPEVLLVGPGVGVVGGVGVGGVDPPPDTVTDAEQLALVPPLEPPQLHVHGPEPATDDAVPAEQRLAEGTDATVVPFDDPHTPLTGAEAAFTATVVLAAGDVPPLPVQVSV
jgi:hypothetical protein